MGKAASDPCMTGQATPLMLPKQEVVASSERKPVGGKMTCYTKTPSKALQQDGVVRVKRERTFVEPPGIESEPNRSRVVVTDHESMSMQ